MSIKIKLLKIYLNLFILYLPHLYVAQEHDQQREAVGEDKVGDVVTEKNVGDTIVSGPPASWSFDFLAKIPQDHSYISPGTI